MDWESVRKEYMLPDGLAYLNSGTAGPCPRCVFEKMVEWQRVLESNPVNASRVYREGLAPAKAALAAFVGTKPSDMVLVLNLTVGMNVVLSGARWLKPGDEILSTDQEYPAVANMTDYYAAERGCTVKRAVIPVPVESADHLVQAIERCITPRTRLIEFPHISSGWAILMPVKRLCRMARERGILTVIDGAHAPGMIPVDVEDIGCDFYVGNCHKWLCSPKGSGFLYVAPSAQGMLSPFVVGHGWVKGKETFLGNMESLGTHSPCAHIGAGEAVKFQARIGKENVAARGRELAKYGREALLQIPGVVPMTPLNPDFQCSMAAYKLPAVDDPKVFGRVCDRLGLVLPASSGPQGGRLRISTHIFNTTGEVDLAVKALREIFKA